ncbi:hypothetical protein GUJ93_ZPchr0374g33336 [Zizania palustris]|uniref:Uncharacterized protein n=1 Tax=Zizania palustris TaxID=103762 RepID=A0A8J5TEB0_ZIZPA|nr:hypothetical protein GUJ93_ZPchr0374g33336 [Zizania palustris]
MITAAAVSSSSYASPAESSVRRRGVGAVRCAPESGSGADGAGKAKLKVGSPIVIVEAPLMLKTAASMPSLRHNGGQVKAGDVGRVMHGEEAEGRLGCAADHRNLSAGRQVLQGTAR